MVKLEDARSINVCLAQSQPLVAVFTGGTSGIGEFTLRTLAACHGSEGQGLRLYIVGRSVKAATRIIAACREVCPAGEFQFIQAKDLALLRDVDRCSQEIIAHEKARSETGVAKVDLLIMSHSDLHFGGRRETDEGLDKSLSFLYYSRMRFIEKLLPVLRASTLPAHVVSIYGAGLEKALHRWSPHDLGLRDPEHYSLLAYRTHAPVMTTFFFEEMAKENAGHLRLTHVFPGLVLTPAFGKDAASPWWFRLMCIVLRPLLAAFVAVPTEEIGDRILYLTSARYPSRGTRDHKVTSDNTSIAVGTDGTPGSGAYSVRHTGERNDLDDVYAQLRQEGIGQLVLEHTRKAFASVDRGERFTD